MDLPWLPPLSPAGSRVFLSLCALGGYWLLMFTSPVRASLRDGLRCVRRYSSLWIILAIFGLTYALFQLVIRLFLWKLLPPDQAPVFQWHRAWFLPDAALSGILRSSVLPATESVAGLFNNIITTFPVSAIAALLLFGNWEGHHGVLFRTLRKRYGAGGWLLYLGILLCGAAAVLKPLVFAAVPYFGLNDETMPLVLMQAAAITDWLSFLFEYLFGVGIQIYLILLAYVWLRGISCTHLKLIDVAIRRFGFVVKWAGIVMLVSTVFIHLPLILSYVPPFSRWMPGHQVLDYLNKVARPLLACWLLIFATIQITLTFHNESLRKSLNDHFRFVRCHWWRLGWLATIGFIHFYALHVANGALLVGMGEGTPLGLCWTMLFPVLWAMVAAWLLAAWVCVFKTCENGAGRIENWIKF